MNTITAPYGFVPLSKTVVLPEWLRLTGKTPPPLHDVPFEDGVCGTLELVIEAETPIFTRGASNKELPFQLDDGSYALPSTALRGALRNVVEIATFSRFSRVNDHRYAVRDLQNRDLYGKYMAEIVENLKTKKKEPMPLVNAGWLSARRNENGEWEGGRIEVCDFAKIEYRNIERVAGERGVRNFRPGNKQSSVDKYKTWGTASLSVSVDVEWRRPDKAGSRPLLSGYGVAFPKEGGRDAQLVFTGQPSFWKPDNMGKRAGAGNAKHHDFVFLAQKTRQERKIAEKVLRDFEFGHSDRGQQNALGRSQEPNPEWKFWEGKLLKNERVPVFFLTDDKGEVESFGLALMFRLPYRNSVKEAVRNVSKAHDPAETDDHRALDFAEGLFGTVRQGAGGRDDRSALALKGRVGISHARASAGAKPQGAVDAILGAPKASYYPNYVEQDPGRPGGQPRQNAAYRVDYKTWNDMDGAPRGWKRYHVLTDTWNPKPPTGTDGRMLDLSKVGTRFHPLPKGTTFTAYVDIHNLKPEELGALAWTLDFGGLSDARHMIGMARPLGYGRVKLSVKASDIYDMKGDPVTMEICREKFVEYMRKEVNDWDTSPQIQELKALARPVPPSAALYQRLDPGARVNEFNEAKRQGLALPSAFAHKSTAAAPAMVATRPAGGQQQGGTWQQNRQGGGHGGQRGPTRNEPIDVPVPRAAPPINHRSAPRPTAGGEPWRGKKRGDIVNVTLTELNRKGKWRCTVDGYAGTQGTLVGTAPADAAAGKSVKAMVVAGNDPMNLELQWLD